MEFLIFLKRSATSSRYFGSLDGASACTPRLLRDALLVHPLSLFSSHLLLLHQLDFRVQISASWRPPPFTTSSSRRRSPRASPSTAPASRYGTSSVRSSSKTKWDEEPTLILASTMPTRTTNTRTTTSSSQGPRRSSCADCLPRSQAEVQHRTTSPTSMVQPTPPVPVDSPEPPTREASSQPMPAPKCIAAP